MEQQDLDCVLAEYKALRNEIVKRIELRQHIVIAAVTIAGALSGIGVQWNNAMVVMLYPLLGVLLAIAWTHHDMSIGGMGGFILREFEIRLCHNGWQKYKRIKRERGDLRFAPIAHCGIIILTQFMANEV